MKILIASDGSKYSQAALDSVCSRTWPMDTEFLVLGVAEPLLTMLDPMLVPYESAAVEDQKKQLREVADAAAARLKEYFPASLASAEVLEGAAADQIVHKARQWGADFVIVGSHGRRGLEKFLLGSVAEAVVSQASCSVEVIKLSPVRPPKSRDKCASIVSS